MTTSKSLVRVLIATTEGPVEVCSLTKYDMGSKSAAVTRGDPYRPIVGFTDWYSAFASPPPTGLIGLLYGEGVFRLDVSGSIESGDSWQLGVLIAHALFAAGRLAGARDPDVGTIVLATGKVDPNDLSVSDVGYVENKLNAALSRLEAEAGAGRTVVVLWPKPNHEDVPPEKIRHLRDCGVRIVGCEAGTKGESSGVETVESALAAVGLRMPEVTLPLQRGSWTGSPFRGLEPFDEEHREIFCGRGRAREEALGRLRKAAANGCGFLLIYGPSGVGKSSLARAGLLGDIARLATEAEEWRRAIVALRGDVAPVAALAEALKGALPELDLSKEALTDAILARWATEAVTKAVARADGHRRVKLVILVDQLEQLFLWAQASDEAKRQRDAFADTLSRLARSGVVWVVATLRSDLMPLLEGVLSRLAKDDNLYRLEQPNRAELREIIRRPAERAGLRLEGCDEASDLPLADVLAEAAARATDSLLLLEFVLERLYAQEGPSGRISYEAYVRLGGLEGAIGAWADKTVAKLGDDPDTVRAIEDVLLQLGRIDPTTGAIVARSATLDDEFSTPIRANVITALEKARLLIFDATDGHRNARVAHEALLTKWERAKEIFEANKAAIELRDRLEGDADHWKDEGDLIPAGRRLADAADLVASGRIELKQRARDYVQASVERAEADANAENSRLTREAARERNRRRVAVVVAFVLFGLVGLTFLAYTAAQIERNRAVTAKEKSIEVNKKSIEVNRWLLISQARMMAANGDFASAIVYAEAAIPSEDLFSIIRPGECGGDACSGDFFRKFVEHVKSIKPAIDVIDDSLPRLRERAVFPLDPSERLPRPPSVRSPRDFARDLGLEPSDSLGLAMLSGDGSLVLTRSTEGTRITIWNVAHLYDQIPIDVPVSGAALSPNLGDDRLFVAAGDNVSVWHARVAFRLPTVRPEAPAPIAIFPVGAPIKSMAITQGDGGLALAVLVADRGGSKVSVVDATSFRQLFSVTEKLPIFGIAFDPTASSRRLLTMSHDEAHIWSQNEPDNPLVLRHENLFNATFSPDGRWVLTTSKDGGSKLWNDRGDLVLDHEIKSGSTSLARSQPGTARPAQRNPCIGTCFLIRPTHCDGSPSPAVATRTRMEGAFGADSRMAVIQGDFGSIEVLDLQRLTIVHRHSAGPWSNVALSPDGEIVLMSDLCSVHLWNLADEGERDLVLSGHSGRIDTARFSSDGSMILTTSSDPKDMTARLWRAQLDPVLPQVSDSITDTAGDTMRSFDLVTADGAEITAELVQRVRRDVRELMSKAKDAVPRCLARSEDTPIFSLVPDVCLAPGVNARLEPDVEHLLP